MSSFWGIVFYIRKIILLGVTAKKTLKWAFSKSGSYHRRPNKHQRSSAKALLKGSITPHCLFVGNMGRESLYNPCIVYSFALLLTSPQKRYFKNPPKLLGPGVSLRG